MGQRLKISGAGLAGVHVVDATPYADDRGSFARWFCARELVDVLAGRPIVQINHSRTVRVGAVRGLHFQHPPHGEMKLIRCLRGRVFDVAVDLRADSPTFLRWQAVHLSAHEHVSVLIPEGCAHGFQSLTDDVELLYCHSAAYQAPAEAGLRATDPKLSILWPLPVGTLSARDAEHPLITDQFAGIEL